MMVSLRLFFLGSSVLKTDGGRGMEKSIKATRSRQTLTVWLRFSSLRLLMNITTLPPSNDNDNLNISNEAMSGPQLPAGGSSGRLDFIFCALDTQATWPTRTMLKQTKDDTPWLVCVSVSAVSWSPNSTDFYFWYIFVNRQIQKT